MQFVQWPDVRLAYDTAGEHGSPVLLVMGFTVPGSAWVHQIPTLAEKHRVAWYDHRGCGDSESAPGVYSMELLARDALRLIDHLGWDRVHLVGVSMGGMVSQELAIRHRDRIRSLTLIATHAGGLRAVVPPPVGLTSFARALLASPNDRNRHVERFLFPKAFRATCDRAWVERILVNDFGTPIPIRNRLSQFAAILRHDTRKRLPQLSGLPTLVVKAAQDLLVSPAATDELSRRIPGARMHVYPEAGHGIIRQCHAELNADLLDHFARAEAH